MPTPRFRDEPAPNPKAIRFPAISATLVAKPRPKKPLSAAEQDAVLVAADQAIDDSDLTPEQRDVAKRRLWAKFLKRMQDERQDGV
jgi:hypothetical protein